MDLKEALIELRKSQKRKFEQSVDLIINLKGLDLRKDNISAIITMPHIVKEKKVCGFLTKKSELVRTITPPDFQRYKDKDSLKELVKSYDFFISHISLMPAVATTFGKALGPAGKMPSPQLGVLSNEEDVAIKAVLNKISHSVKIRLKESSLKVGVGKENMKDEEIISNIVTIYNALLKVLTKEKENIKNVELKFTMTKPVKIKIR